MRATSTWAAREQVLKGCAGAALMGDLPLARRRSRGCAAATIPLTVKFRLGLDDSRRNFSTSGRCAKTRAVAAVRDARAHARQM